MTCRRSLSAASDLLSAKKDKEIDARLFLVRHLLILKEMTANLDLGRKDRKKDWQGITGSLRRMHPEAKLTADFLKSLLSNASYMLGYGRGSVVRASDVSPDAKTVRLLETLRAATNSRTWTESSNERARTSSDSARNPPRHPSSPSSRSVRPISLLDPLHRPIYRHKPLRPRTR